jgi:hypothetical protein
MHSCMHRTNIRGTQMSNRRKLGHGMAQPAGCTGKIATCQCEKHWGVTRATTYSDDAKRFAAEVNLQLTAGGFDVIGKFMAIRLRDGGTDHAVYDSTAEAARFQPDEDKCFYFQIPLDGLTDKEAAIGLQWYRAGHDAGQRYRTMDGNQLIMPITNEEIARQYRALRRMAN